MPYVGRVREVVCILGYFCNQNSGGPSIRLLYVAVAVMWPAAVMWPSYEELKFCETRAEGFHAK